MDLYFKTEKLECEEQEKMLIISNDATSTDFV